MLKDFAQYLVSLGKTPPTTETIDGTRFRLNESGRISGTVEGMLKTLERTEEMATMEHDFAMVAKRSELECAAYHREPALIKTSTLTSITHYVKDNPEDFFDDYHKPLIHIASATEVRLMTAMDYEGKRSQVLAATAITPSIPFDKFMSVEQFVITLQTLFTPDGDWETVLRMVSNITDQESFHVKDDGVRQTVTIKKGVADIGEEKVPNPVTLAPFRTFSEAEQPLGHYTLRINDKGMPALFAVGGAEWQITAMSNIRRYLDEALEDVDVDILM